MNILLAGVGGQGLVLATEIISQAALMDGYDVKTSDVVGLSQRGGYVFGSVRYGKKVPSALIPKGKVDILVGLEQLEALRWISHLKKTSVIILNELKIFPNLVLLEKEKYPLDIPSKLSSICNDINLVDALKISKKIGNLKLVNTILLGKMSSFTSISDSSFEKSIQKSVPSKTVDDNIKAFYLGKEA